MTMRVNSVSDEGIAGERRMKAAAAEEQRRPAPQPRAPDVHAASSSSAGRKQALRSHHQHDRHQKIDQHRGQRGRRSRRRRATEAPDGAGSAERRGRACRSGRRRCAAKNAPRIEPMPPITMTTKARIRMCSPIPICTVRIGACHQAGKAGERSAEPEHQRIEQLDVDAERADHLAIGGAGADQHADAGPHHAR